MVFTMLCRGQMLFLADRDDDSGTLVQAPTYVLEFPDEREVERYLDGCGPGLSPGFFRPTCALDVFRRTPKAYAAPDDRAIDWYDISGLEFGLSGEEAAAGSPGSEE